MDQTSPPPSATAQTNNTHTLNSLKQTSFDLLGGFASTISDTFSSFIPSSTATTTNNAPSIQSQPDLISSTTKQNDLFDPFGNATTISQTQQQTGQPQGAGGSTLDSLLGGWDSFMSAPNTVNKGSMNNLYNAQQKNVEIPPKQKDPFADLGKFYCKQSSVYWKKLCSFLLILNLLMTQELSKIKFQVYY